MTFAAYAQIALDQVFAALGTTATYRPPAGADIVCTVIRSSPDVTVAGPSNLRPIAEANTIEVRKSDVAAPSRGGLFILGAETLKIIGDPKCEDPERLIWTCTVSK